MPSGPIQYINTLFKEYVMFRNLESFSASNNHEWFTISESASLLSELTGLKTRDYDIYRYAIFGRINLSIYFQSPVFCGR